MNFTLIRAFSAVGSDLAPLSFQVFLKFSIVCGYGAPESDQVSITCLLFGGVISRARESASCTCIFEVANRSAATNDAISGAKFRIWSGVAAIRLIVGVYPFSSVSRHIVHTVSTGPAGVLVHRCKTDGRSL